MATISPERTETLTGTDFELVVLPVDIILHRNPETGDTSIMWRWTQHLSVDGAVRKKDYVKTGSNFREFADIASLQPAYVGAIDPYTSADLTDISMAGVVQILLDAFDRAYVQDSAV